MSQFSINMLSSADSVPGQGVGSAYVEQVQLVEDGSKGLFDVYVNDKKQHEIQHFHTINYKHYLKMKRGGSINVAYVHFLPHTLDGSIKLPKVIFNILKKYVIKFYKSADALIVVNPIFIKELAQYDIPLEKIHYIPNYVSKEMFYKEDTNQVSKTKEKYKIGLKSKVVLGVGQVQTRKGVVDFVEVAKKLPEYEFVWCGGFSFGNITDGYKELKEIVDNPPSNVKFLGIVTREEMNSIYNVADVLFMPSYNELFPMSILEAISSGVPLLLRDLELYEDILFNKYIKASDNDSFVKQLDKLLSDDEYYSKCSNESSEISQFYSKESVYVQWEDFYQSIFDKYNKKINFTKINKQHFKKELNNKGE